MATFSSLYHPESQAHIFQLGLNFTENDIHAMDIFQLSISFNCNFLQLFSHLIWIDGILHPDKFNFPSLILLSLLLDHQICI